MRTPVRIPIPAATPSRPVLMALGLLLVALLVYWPSSGELWGYWLQAGGTTQYGLIVAAISVWLLFRSRAALAPIEPLPRVLPALIVVSAGSMLFWRAGIESLQLVLLPPLLFLAVLGALGIRIARIVAFPIGFLYFAVPGWGFLGPVLQLLTIRAVSVIAQLTGLPAHVSGDLVTLPGTAVFEIGSKCSGVEFLVVGLAVAALIGELEHTSLPRRVWLMALMGAIAVVSNWARVFLIIAIGYATQMHSSLATSQHLLFGWIVFASALLLYLWLAPRTARAATEGRESAAAPSAAHASRATAGAVATVAALIVFPGWVYAMDLAHGSRPPAMELAPPQARAPWSGPLEPADSQWRPRFAGADIERQALYDGPSGRSVELLIVGYGRQEHGHKLVSEENSLTRGRGLVTISYGFAHVAGYRFSELVTEDGAGHRSIIWWVYDIGGRRFATALYSELWYGFDALIHPPYSAVFALKTECRPSCGAARATLESFVKSNGRRLFATARATRSGSPGGHA